jgi:hypothetical protein
VSEWDICTCCIDGSEKSLLPGAIREAAQIAKWHFGSQKQSHDLSENHVLRFNSTQTHAKRVLIRWLKADDLPGPTPNPCSGGGTWDLQPREEIGVTAADNRFADTVVLGPAHVESRLRLRGRQFLL